MKIQKNLSVQMTQEAMAPYLNIIKIKMRREGYKLVNAVLDLEDVESELRFVLVEKWEKLQEYIPEHRVNMFSRMCHNHIVNRIIHFTKRPDTSIYSKFDEENGFTENSQEFESMEHALNHGSRFDSPESTFFCKELVIELRSWAKSHSDEANMFIEAILNPSEEIQTWWAEQQEKTVKYRGYDFPPPQTLVYKLFGSKKLQYKFLNSLREYLAKRGYLDAPTVC